MPDDARDTPPLDAAPPEHALPTGDLAAFDLELEDLVERSADAILFLDLRGIVRYWNRGATRTFRYEPAEALGREVSFLLPPDLRHGGELLRLRSACAADGVVYNFTTRRLRKDGKEVWVSLTRTVLHDRRGREIGVVATMRDVTEQRAREQELQGSRSLALVGELAAKVAHEVKNPLTGIYAALQVLEGQLEPEDPRREVFQSIGDEVKRLNGITQDLLSFARPAQPKLVQDDLARFLVELCEDLERIQVVRPGELDTSALWTPLLVSFDHELVGQVFKNLILNGVQANAGKGTVRLLPRVSDEWVVVDVADDGPGIPAEVRARVFEPFFTTKSRGTGLGLSIAHKNMQLMGGRLRLRGQKSRGATFRVEFARS
ncbi:MAG: PAS domain S-box protein [Planctomycetes bacterium]|nr:PAS domain S-box protein [Planctomycetota bacterium]